MDVYVDWETPWPWLGRLVYFLPEVFGRSSYFYTQPNGSKLASCPSPQNDWDVGKMRRGATREVQFLPKADGIVLQVHPVKAFVNWLYT